MFPIQILPILGRSIINRLHPNNKFCGQMAVLVNLERSRNWHEQFDLLSLFEGNDEHNGISEKRNKLIVRQ